jgi:hypothetical protein
MQPRNQASRAQEEIFARLPGMECPDLRKLATGLGATLADSMNFLLPADLLSMSGDLAQLVGLRRLPTPVTFVESEEISALACNLSSLERSIGAALPLVSETLMIWPVTHGAVCPCGIAIAEAALAQAAETGVVPGHPVVLGEPGRRFLREADVYSVFAPCLRLVGTLTALLACRNVSTEVIPAPARLNRARVARGKLPLPDYHTLTIKLTETRHVGGGSQGGHGSPRSHLRRGHIRQLPNGPIWVSPAVINPGHGWVGKRYALRA